MSDFGSLYWHPQPVSSSLDGPDRSHLVCIRRKVMEQRWLKEAIATLYGGAQS